MFRPTIAFVLVTLAAACGGSEKKPAEKPVQPMAAGDYSTLCVQSFQRQRECTAEYIPALVALRVSKDTPAGIAATDAEIGRDALVAKANEEWATDSTDEAIAQTCEKILATTPAPGLDHLATSAEQCLAADSCQGFVDCIVPVIGEHMGAPPPQ